MVAVQYTLDETILAQTFAELRRCGRQARECQVLWTSSWAARDRITRVVHPRHSSSHGGFQVESRWLTQFAFEIADLQEGVRIQVHTHPGTAFHSVTDDRFPAVSTPGFLSLVIPNFARGAISFDGAYLAELQADGQWMHIREITERISVTCFSAPQ